MAQPAVARSLRALTLSLVVVGHGLALGLFVLGCWRLGLALLLPAGLAWVWGTLHPQSRLFGSVIRRLDTQQPVVWLSFDDGPSIDTPDLLEVLDRHAAQATFFLVGERACRMPDLVRAIVRRGHQIGNHSAHHPSAWFWALPPARMRKEIEHAQMQLTELAGRPPRWFRAVAGHANLFVDPVLRRLGLTRVAWSVRSFDTVDRNDDRVLARLLAGLKPGAIVLLHEDASSPGRSVRLLDRLLTELARRGYSTVVPDGDATNSQLLNGVRPQSGAQRTVSPSPANSASSSARTG